MVDEDAIAWTKRIKKGLSSDKVIYQLTSQEIVPFLVDTPFL